MKILSKPPRYTIDIDEEGFPHFDGLRVSDEDFVKSLLQNIRRIDPANPRSAIVTECEGEVCLVNAFESPLVAQSIESADEKGADWIFPGGLCFRVMHSDLRVDEWNRLHAMVGDACVPATLTRKAQAALLLAASFPRDLAPLRQHEAPPEIGDSQYWEQAYQEKRDGWELGEASPVLVAESARVLAALRDRALRRGILECVVPGAGRGHDAHWLDSQLGASAKVRAIDLAPSAASEHAKLYPSSRVKYVRADAFEWMQKNGSAIDAVFEHTFFCAFDPERRQEWLEKVFAALKPGGLYFGVFWLRDSRGGPPFGLSQWELRERVQKCGFHVKDWKLSRASIESRWGQELWVVLERPQN